MSTRGQVVQEREVALVDLVDRLLEALYGRERDDRLFHVGLLGDEPLKTVVCERCGGTDFNVGVGRDYAAIRCPRCAWERGVRDR